jgi:hypothetical protein
MAMAQSATAATIVRVIHSRRRLGAVPDRCLAVWFGLLTPFDALSAREEDQPACA